jgi:UDP-glucose 4-epimerase
MPGSVDKLGGARVLVTGASGFIGSSLVGRLVEHEAEVHAISRRHESGKRDAVRWWRADLAEPHAVTDVVRSTEPDTIFHLASHVSGATAPGLVLPTLRSNLLSTIDVLEAAREAGCRRVVVAGTMVEPDVGSSNPVPGSPYAASKWASSGYARMFHALWQVPVVILRIFMVYGPGQPDLRKIVPHVIVSLLRGERPKLSSSGLDVDWVYLGDVVDAFVSAATVPGIEGETIDVGSGELVSIGALAERAARLVGTDVRPELAAKSDRPLEFPRTADLQSAADIMGWRPRVALDEGLRRTVEWYRARLPELSSAT